MQMPVALGKDELTMLLCTPPIFTQFIQRGVTTGTPRSANHFFLWLRL